MAAKYKLYSFSVSIIGNIARVESFTAKYDPRGTNVNPGRFIERIKEGYRASCQMDLAFREEQFVFLSILSYIPGFLTKNPSISRFSLHIYVKPDTFLPMNQKRVVDAMNVIRGNHHIKYLDLYFRDDAYRISGDVLKDMFETIGTLDLQKIKISLTGRVPHPDNLVNELRQNTHLISVELSFGLNLQGQHAGFLFKLMEFVPIIDISSVLNSEEVDVLAEGLRTKSVVRVLSFKSLKRDDFTTLALALRTNDTLQSLKFSTWDVFISEATPGLATPVFEALKDNISLLKLEISVVARDIPTLRGLLEVNSTLEDLNLIFAYRPSIEIINALSVIVANSSLINVKVSYNDKQIPLTGEAQEIIDRRRHNVMRQSQTLLGLLM